MCHLKQVVNWFDGIIGQPIFFSMPKINKWTEKLLNVKNNKIVKNKSLMHRFLSLHNSKLPMISSL